MITDDYHGAYEAVCHLARWPECIGLISGPLKISNAKERWQGFHDALKSEGLAYDPNSSSKVITGSNRGFAPDTRFSLTVRMASTSRII